MVHSKLLIVALLFLAAVPIALARQEPGSVRKSQVGTHSFEVGQLKLTIAKFRGGTTHSWLVLLASPPIKTPHSIEVRVENQSGAAQMFDPNLLSFVSKGGKQVNVRFRTQAGFSSPEVPPETPLPRSIAPGAHIQEFYHLNGKVGFPARLFYDGKELAVITD